MDVNRLKALMVLHGKSIDDLCDAAGICKTSMWRRMRGEVSFTVGEVTRIALLLRMSTEDIMRIFFADVVSIKRHNGVEHESTCSL